MGVFVAGAIAAANHPIYAVAVLGASKHKIFADTPPNPLSYDSAAQAIDFIANEPDVPFCSNGLHTFRALVSIFSRFSDTTRAELAAKLYGNGADVSQTTSLASIFRNNAHGPVYCPADYSFVTWNLNPKEVFRSLVNDTACLAYLESTTTTEGKLARIEGGGAVDAQFYKHWTEGFPQRIVYGKNVLSINKRLV